MASRIPFKPSLLTKRTQTVRWLIIHHTNELYVQPNVKVDNDDPQMQGIYNGVLAHKEADINYHYVVEKVKGDYSAIIARPASYLCDWFDIDSNINNRAIHIAVLGDYSSKTAEDRMYQVLAYKIINPLLHHHGISSSQIKLHSEVSNEDITCPGTSFDKDRLISQVKRFVVK